MNPVELPDLFELDDAAFRGRFRRTPLWRAGRRGLLSSAAIVLGNRPDAAAISPLVRGLGDAEPSVRAASAWALGRHADPAAQNALRARLTLEADPQVRGEIERAIR
jgi:epoxyqueuosine reductase